VRVGLEEPPGEIGLRQFPQPDDQLVHVGVVSTEHGSVVPVACSDIHLLQLDLDPRGSPPDPEAEPSSPTLAVQDRHRTWRLG
jgi:hypothetical protein